MKIAVVGTGYVGLVTGTCFAELGNDVTCIDNNASKVVAMQSGKIPIYEPGLEEVFLRNIENGRLRFSTELPAVQAAEVVFLALPTPPGEDGAADLSYILGVADELGSLLQGYTLVVNKSTVPVGTSEAVRERIASRATAAFDVVSNPEFLREGFAVTDFLHPDRIVVGTNSEQSRAIMQKLYAPLTEQGHSLLLMDTRSAELTKYAANAFLALKITYMNEMANLCERLDADVDAIRSGIGSDERIGSRFLYPGIGYGGSCFPKDVQALVHTAREYGYSLSLLEDTVRLNVSQQKVLIEKIMRYYQNDLTGKHFALWGLAFKPNTDDIRQAPALKIIEALTKAGATVTAYDPEAMEHVRTQQADNTRLQFADSPKAALIDADALLIATEWEVFKAITPATLAATMPKHKVVFDGRNIYDPPAMQAAGFYYESIGRRIVDPTTDKELRRAVGV